MRSAITILLTISIVISFMNLVWSVLNYLKARENEERKELIDNEVNENLTLLKEIENNQTEELINPDAITDIQFDIQDINEKLNIIYNKIMEEK